MPRYLDPKAGIVFKKIFGEHPHLLISFLNAILPLPDDQHIVSLIYLKSEQVPKVPGLKFTIADVKCTDNHGRIFIVEMQIDWVESFKQRLLFESGQAYVKQLEKGENYHMLKPVYGLGLIASTFDPDPNHWYHHYQLVNVEKPEKEIIDQLQLVFIEIPKFPVKSSHDKKLRILWLRFMREINQKTISVDQELLAVPEIKEALDLAQEAAYTPSEMQAYDDYWNQVSTEKTLIAGKFLEGVAEGEAKGRAEEKRQIAKQMLADGMDMAMIAKYTGLPEKEIK